MANTVSPNYCHEITQPEDQNRYFEGGKGLHAIAQKLYEGGRLIGILNGFHYPLQATGKSFDEIWNRKKQAKMSLGKDFENPDFFLLGFVGRAVEQTMKLLAEEIDRKSVPDHILNIPGVNVALLATGLPEYESFLRQIGVNEDQRGFLPPQSSQRKNYSFTIAFVREKAPQISLGSDVFLMPSLFEPCGIAQMESLSHATPPLVRWTGGLADMVKPYTRRNGTGFGFNGATRDDLLHAFIKTVHEAFTMYKSHGEAFKQLQKRGFRERFVWSTSAKKYIDELYLPALKRSS